MNKIWQIINVEKSYWTDTLSPCQMSTCSESSICTVACEHKGSHLSKQTYNNKFCVQEPPVWSRILHITSACAQLHRTDINKSYIFQSDLLVHGHIQKCPQITNLTSKGWIYHYVHAVDCQYYIQKACNCVKIPHDCSLCCLTWKCHVLQQEQYDSM